MRISPAILPALKAATNVAPPLLPVQVPAYDRADLKAGIVHVGVGNFHRGHMSAYLDDLFDMGEGLDFGVVGASLYSPKRRDALEPQGWLQCLVQRDGESARCRVLGCMMDYLPVDSANGHPELQKMLLEPDIKIVSLTITEGGYFLDPGSGKFDDKHPDMQHDAANPDTPKTVFGMILKALKLRRAAGVKPFTILSCDNVMHNGDVVQKVVQGLAKMSDPELAEWMGEHVTCPNGMVDRIVPATTDAERKYLQETFGVDDEYPVFCEPFTQWVLEDNFCNGRPALEKVGVQFVPDVTPYETMKLRILNGGHASLCYPSALLDVQYVHNSMEHPTIGPFLGCLENTEMIPAVPPVPDTDLQEYWEIIAGRFANPTLCDTIKRNSNDGSDRQTKFIIPIIKDNLEAGRPVDGLAMVSAMWCRYCRGTTESGKKCGENDALWDRLNKLALEAPENPQGWLDQKDIYGSVGQNPVFQEAFAKAVKMIDEKGVEGALKEYIAQNSETSNVDAAAAAA